MLIAGGIGIGLVVGWLAARLLYRARWTKIVRVLLAIIVQALVVLWLATPLALLAFTIALVLGALICAAWLHALRLRYAALS